MEQQQQLDKNLFWTGIVYFVGLYLLHVVWWQALLVGVAMAISWYLTYSRRMVAMVGVLILLLGFGSWVGLVPDLPHWGHWIASLRLESQ